jgi:hypothetical protein
VHINKEKSFTNGRAHINGIEAFWSFPKRRLAITAGLWASSPFQVFGNGMMEDGEGRMINFKKYNHPAHDKCWQRPDHEFVQGPGPTT